MIYLSARPRAAYDHFYPFPGGRGNAGLSRRRFGPGIPTWLVTPDERHARDSGEATIWEALGRWHW